MAHRRKIDGNSLSEAVLFEILLRLPASAVVKFRDVCKLWRSMTCEPYFIRSHVDRHTTDPPAVLIFSRDPVNLRFCITVIDESGKPKYRLSRPGREVCAKMECCSGLMCFYYVDYDEEDQDERGKLELLNPTTGQSLTLPKSPNFPTNCGPPYFFLGFQPARKKLQVVHFYNRTSTRRIPRIEGPTDMECEAYTLGASSWRQIGTCDCRPFAVGLSINGIIYMMAHKYREDRTLILSLDLETEKFAQIQLPNSENEYFYRRCGPYLVELEGKVGLVRYPSISEMKIWMLDDQLTWIPKHTILMPTRLYQLPVPRPVLIQKEKILVRKYPMLQYHSLNGDTEWFEVVHEDRRSYTAFVLRESLITL